MIYTCTLNPSIDYKIEANELHIGMLNRPEKTAFYPGGKGINVSLVLKNLDIQNIALGFVGGFTGDFLKDCLKKKGVLFDFIEHNEPTRINVKIKTNLEETEINGNGAYISKEAEDEFLLKMNSLTKHDYLIISGSIPSSVSNNIYEEIAKICMKKEVPFIVDISDSSLLDLLKYRPFLIKPNQYELGELLGIEINSKEEVIKAGKELVESGAENVIVSMGGNGAIFINHEMRAYAKVPKGDVRSSVGAGDSTVAGFLASYLNNRDVMEAFRYGVASGTATAFSMDLCKKDEVENIFPQVEIEILQ
ncbi:fructose-1-phosphate kinase [Bacillus oleivorans]|uniref:1-phosphofructokinase n=1 Tax=Bacillus oleivorans TaxID=1448271 RepID=A0A285D3M4_9BACI|nr:1-phosphofructokinase [Bacillus oleivorans]SNX74379.1 fructose-1-phosphate kinase [Bacillus oleivorans]